MRKAWHIVSYSYFFFYAYVREGRKVSSKYEEEEQFEDLSLLIEMLTNLLSKDFIDFGQDSDDENTKEQGAGAAPCDINVSEVVIFAMSKITPLMNAELLKVCKIYCWLYLSVECMVNFYKIGLWILYTYFIPTIIYFLTNFVFHKLQFKLFNIFFLFNWMNLLFLHKYRFSVEQILLI